MITRRMRSTIVTFAVVMSVTIFLLHWNTVDIVESNMNQKVVCKTDHRRSDGQIDWNQQFDIDSLTGRQLVDYLHWTNGSSCALANYFGGAMSLASLEGQKAVCMDPQVSMDHSRCLVYSFGINDEWSFEDAISRYECDVYAFDPSMNKTDHDRSGRIHFFAIGLSGTNKVINKNWHLRTLSSIYSELSARHGDGAIIDYLKLDIESHEWDALPDILRSGMMDRVRQLGVEIHLPERDDTAISEIRSIVATLRSLEDYGMVRFDSKPNPFSEGEIYPFGFNDFAAYEIAWYNNRLRRSRRFYF